MLYEVITVSEEVEFLSHYLELQYLRFKERLVYTLPEHIGSEIHITKFSLFNIVADLVENLIEPSLCPGELSITTGTDSVSIVCLCGSSLKNYMIKGSRQNANQVRL